MKHALVTAALLLAATGISFAGVSAAPLPGTFVGLVQTTTSNLPAVSTSGYITLTILANETFTGKLMVDGQTQSLAGSFDGGGFAVFGPTHLSTLTITRLNQPSLYVVLSTLVSAGGSRITGTLTQKYRSATVASSTITLDRAPYDGKTSLVPAPYLNAANADGVFTVKMPALPATSQPGGFTTADYPQGTGFGTLKITKAGVVSLIGFLADGTALSASGNVVVLPDHSTKSVPLFAQLYNKGGFVSASVTLESTNATSDLSAGTTGMKWYRPFSLTEYYPYGWPEVITTGLLGAKYLAVKGSSVIPGITPPAIGNPGNAYLKIRDGRLTANFDRGVLISNADGVTKFPTTDTSFTLVIPRSTGLFTGTFLHTDGTNPAFKGVIYQKGTESGGFGYFLSTTKVIDYLGQGGSVVVNAAGH